ncbi:MAG: HAMP domain-containing histidine kinase [Hyphomonadaceae bacterium]|jgi:signal transduction histidine kinase|nr:HAMP domain-containing histidine kinase [Hyphomonadaceae bacterium]
MILSLRLRLLLVGLFAAVTIPAFAAVGLRAAFEHHVTATHVGELEADLRYLTRSLRVEDGTVALAPVTLPDPRFSEPLSGLYWQIVDDATGANTRSGSLMTFMIDLPKDDLPLGTIHRHDLAGPDGSHLLLLERRIPDGPDRKRSWRFAVAIDRALLDNETDAFMADLLPVLLLLAAGLVGMSLAQTVIILAPLGKARAAFAGLKAGHNARLSGAFPPELGSIARDFDALLDTAERQARETRERAADLAHGLRTPLAVLMARAEEAEALGQGAMAASIREVVADLDQRAARDLARTHIHGPVPGRTTDLVLAPAIGRIVSALARSPLAAAITWEVEIDPAHQVRMDASDLTELVGSVLDNARKWARHKVRIASATNNGSMILTFEDDGCGIDPQHRRAALTRGIRLDCERSGTGLGLAIAQEIAQAYRGTLELHDSALGGLRVVVRLPANPGR